MEAKHSSTELSQKSTKNNSGSKHLVVDSYTVDEAAALTAGQDFHVTPEDAARVRRKIDLHLMPLMCLLYLMTFMDKTTLGQSATLGILTSAKLTTDEFNWLGTIFYIAYLFFQWPQNLALQRFPVGKWMSVNVFVWAVALLCHAACKSFGSLFAVRLIMGIAEGAITPGFMLLTSMFYTRVEQTRRVGYWFLMNGVAIIILGFVAFGVLHTTNENFQPWQWLMVITGLITLIISVIFWFFFPDSPMTAHFLSEDERLIAVERIKVNQAGVENKHFKRDQFVETMCDPKTYLLFFFAASSNVVNSLTNQRQIIVKLFGFSTIDTTLLGCVDGVVEILVIWLGVFLAAHFKNARVYSAISLYVPAILGSILVTTLPADNKVGRLFSYWISIFAFPPFVIVLGWVGQITAGHTKKTTTNAVVLIGYSVGNAAGPAMWKSQYQPLNHVPWAIISGCSFLSAIILLITRIYLARENNLRDSENQDSVYDDAVIVVEDGSNEKEKEKKVDKAFLDLTDRQNRDFRYVL